MSKRANIWGFALATVLVQSADWTHIGRTTDFDLYVDPASIRHQADGRVVFKVKREYSYEDNALLFGAGEADFVAISNIVGDCVRRTITGLDVTIERPTGEVLAQDRAPHPAPVVVDPGSAGEAELEMACGHKNAPTGPHA